MATSHQTLIPLLQGFTLERIPRSCSSPDDNAGTSPSLLWRTSGRFCSYTNQPSGPSRVVHPFSPLFAQDLIVTCSMFGVPLSCKSLPNIAIFSRLQVTRCLCIGSVCGSVKEDLHYLCHVMGFLACVPETGACDGLRP